MNASRLPRSSVLAATTLLAWGASGCGDLLQAAAPGAALGEPLRVRALTNGEPAPRLWVEWSVLAGSGTVEPRNSFSNANGIAETGWILGPSDGPQQVQAIVRKGIPVTFDATAESP